MKKLIGGWDVHEKEMLKILAFILAFYVKLVVGRYMEQVSKVPSLEGVCQVMNGMARHTDDEKLREYKQTIARYCLLSWTMCLTSVSSTFKKEFDTEKEYIKKGLMTQKELDMLTMGKKIADAQGWTDKWNVPISWATLMLNEGAVGKEGFIKKDHKFVVKTVGAVQDDLAHIAEHFENQVPTIMTQAVTIAIWGFLICGVISGQDVQDVDNVDSMPVPVSLILNFPLLQCIKYLLLFAWLRVALSLQNPFEYKDGFGMNLHLRLDVEIWKASFMTSKESFPAHANLMLT